MAICGILNYDAPLVKDVAGCRLPVGHGGPHEFIGSDGATYQWETDWNCDCEHCASAEGDYCTIYWCVAPVEAQAA
jgi:hypothetical protein